MTPRGTTYVTVGSHGFYYRETISTGSISQDHSASSDHTRQPQTSSSADAIPSASVSELVDSSSERLVQQLNERARMSNPAWLLYVAAAAALAGLLLLPPVPALPSLPSLPDVTMRFSAERARNTTDEYSMLTARYGEPNSVLLTDGPVPVGTARYDAVHVDVVFVPNGCVEAYGEVERGFADRPRYSAPAKSRTKGGKQCGASPITGWTTIKYINTPENYEIPADIATARLDKITVKRAARPIPERRGSADGRLKPSPEMQSNKESQVAVQQLRRKVEAMRRDVEADGQRVLYSEVGLPVCALGLFVAGLFVHRKNTRERISRLFYELGEAEQQRHSIVHQAGAGVLARAQYPVADGERGSEPCRGQLLAQFMWPA